MPLINEKSMDFNGMELECAELTCTGSVNMGVGGFIDLDSETKTLSSNAVTTIKYAVVVTTESLTTAHTATQALVITKVGVASGDLAMISAAGGTNTQGVPVFNAVCTTDTVTITLRNNAIITNAFNGTFIFNLVIFKK